MCVLFSCIATRRRRGDSGKFLGRGSVAIRRPQPLVLGPVFFLRVEVEANRQELPEFGGLQGLSLAGKKGPGMVAGKEKRVGGLMN